MEEVLENLRKAILEYDGASAEDWAKKAVEAGTNALQISELITSTMRQIGHGFGTGEFWLPDLVGAASAAQKATLIVNNQIMKQGNKPRSLGRVVIGTVSGDIHDIGKSMVATLLLANGFDVIDLGVDVSAEAFVSAVKEHNANILAMSALLTVTAHEQAKVIKYLKDTGTRDKVAIMVGGAPISQRFSEEIGADGYASTAQGAVELAKHLIRL